MSRVGKRVIKVPPGVKVSFNAPLLEISGKVGTIKRELPPSIGIEVKGDEVNVKNLSDDPDKHSLHGLWRTLVQNMVHGVINGFSRDLELQGVGYRAAVQGAKLTLQVGFSHPVEFALPQGVTAAVEANTKISIKGADKELIGLIASTLRKIKPPEPYKGKGIRYAGEVVQLKQGKTAGAGGSGGAK